MEFIILLTFTIILMFGMQYQIKRNPATLSVGTYGIFIILIFIGMIALAFNSPLVGMYHIFVLSYFFASIVGIFLLLSIGWYSYKKTKKSYILSLILVYLAINIMLFNYHDVFFSLMMLPSYFLIQFVRFLISSIVYGMVIKAPKKGPLVVLGGGLVNGYQIGDIVDQRIAAAVNDAKTINPFPTIVFSGGQGEDELISEAEAMRDWAVKKYQVPFSKTMLENRSRNTYQNLQFCHEMLPEQSFTFYTSNYHVLRGALLAQKQNINVQGRGGYVNWQYRIPAFIREFAGTMSIYKWRQVFCAFSWVVIVFIGLIFK
ncbi:ElyC/SanA/YdcF family protein [Leuconostoc palmae]|uniref:ElyC/SanA/YdcF family protein n=1 Tax=Leuconostoc palmae TaxID=501487 RepID=UPI001C7DBD8D|nr:ElyC/SanA/YdcF family protein [Leuconostoc palmae]